MSFIKLLSRLPLSVLYILSDFLYLVNYYLIRYRRTLVMKNLRNSFPEKSEPELHTLEKEFYRNLADVSIETLKAITISKKELGKRVIIHGNLVEEAMKAGKPMIFITSHFSNWELEWIALSTHFHFEMHAAYKKLRNSFVNKLIFELRSRFGGIMHEKNEVVADMAKLGQRKYIMAMAGDQRPSSGAKKYWATFMNQDAAFYSGTEILARRMDASVVYLSMHRLRRGFYEITCELITSTPKLLQKNEITNTFIRLMERDIRKDPASYLWSHNRWKFIKPTGSN
ncbi:MAG: lysophospholipid acyltransferase family protein [Cyclobacteriaceae bacterium]|nr:lysophospholipid acyltransferase family protein [Cyclobacteriaceae bacterium]